MDWTIVVSAQISFAAGLWVFPENILYAIPQLIRADLILFQGHDFSKQYISSLVYFFIKILHFEQNLLDFFCPPFQRNVFWQST
jgi:hypothetical protein